jgi:hypothetical protein
MTAAWLCARAELRRRWRSWVVLGLLVGVSVGLACAAVAGARRTNRAVGTYARVAQLPDAAVLANDPAFDDAKRAELAELPEVEGVIPFAVPFALQVAEPAGIESPLLPTDSVGSRRSLTPLLTGRLPAVDRPDEIAVNEIARDELGLDIGETVVLVQEPIEEGDLPIPIPLPPRSAEGLEQRMRVVGIVDATGDDPPELFPSSGFYRAYRDHLVKVINAFVDLRGDEAQLDRFRSDVDRIMGRPTNVESVSDLFGVRQARNISDVEAAGLLMFALAVLVGAGALVGQALVRTTTAGAADYETWRAIGLDRRTTVRAMIAPAGPIALVGAMTTVVTAILLSPLFPIAETRQLDLDIGYHADGPVLVAGVLGLIVAVGLTSWIAAQLRARQAQRAPRQKAPWLRIASVPPVFLVGSRLATDTGRGHRAVPVRSALVGAIVGVVGVVGCLTFRVGLTDASKEPIRSGVVWDHFIATSGSLPSSDVEAIASDPAVDGALRATWARAVSTGDGSIPVFGTKTVEDGIDFIVLAGEPPRSADEIVVAPTTMKQLGLHIGDRLTVGEGPGRPVTIVGRALLPETSHTSYDQGSWMTHEGLVASLPEDIDPNSDLFEDYLLLEWRPEADVKAATARLARVGDGMYESQQAELPLTVETLRGLRVLPLVLSGFFGLLAVATVAHALVTTVRRRRSDLAVIRSLGFTRRDTRLAIAWQSTVFALAGLVIGVPLGVIVGRALWRQLADSFPVAYVPPVALVAVLLVVPAALAIANALAVGPAHAATRLRPAAALRTE